MIGQNGYGFAELARNSPKYLPKPESLSWLREYVANFNPDNYVFPYERLLKESLYYPACAFDMRPINALGKSINSFVYADVWAEKEDVHKYLFSPGYRTDLSIEDMDFNYYFNGHVINYDLFFMTELRLEDFGFDDSKPPILPSDFYSYGTTLDNNLDYVNEPFVIWMILEERKAYYRDKRLISVLYFGGEMSTIYQGLYIKNFLVPKVVMYYNPGQGFWDDGIYTHKSNKTGQFFQYVMRSNPAGMPDFYISKEWNSLSYRNKTLSGYEDIEDCYLLKKKKY